MRSSRRPDGTGPGLNWPASGFLMKSVMPSPICRDFPEGIRDLRCQGQAPWSEGRVYGDSHTPWCSRRQRTTCTSLQWSIRVVVRSTGSLGRGTTSRLDGHGRPQASPSRWTRASRWKPHQVDTPSKSTGGSLVCWVPRRSLIVNGSAGAGVPTGCSSRSPIQRWAASPPCIGWGDCSAFTLA